MQQVVSPLPLIPRVAVKFVLHMQSKFHIIIIKMVFLAIRFSLIENCVISAEGWSGGAKVLCILHHQGVQLILVYSWARPAILVAGKGKEGMFLFLLFLPGVSFLFLFISSTISSISFLPFSGRRHK